MVAGSVRQDEIVVVEDCLEEDSGSSSQPGDRYFPSTDPAWSGRSSRSERRRARRGGRSGYAQARDGNLFDSGNDNASDADTAITIEDRRRLHLAAARRVFGQDKWSRAVQQVYSMSSARLRSEISKQIAVLACLRARRAFVTLCAAVAQ